MVKGRFVLVVAVLAMLVLAACGGGGASDTASLDQSYSGSNITFNYPGGWVVEEQGDSGTVLVASGQATMDIMSGAVEGEPAPGELGMSLMVMPTADVVALFDPPTAMAVLEGMFVDTISRSEGVEVSDPEEVTLGGKTVARVTATGTESDTVVYVVEVSEDALVVVYAATLPGEIGNYSGTVERIIESLSYQG